MKRVELFDSHGNGRWFDVPDDAYRHVLRNLEGYDGGVETHDSETRSVTVEDVVQTDDPARLNVDLIVRAVRGETEEEEAAWIAATRLRR